MHAPGVDRETDIGERANARRLVMKVELLWSTSGLPPDGWSV
jgi:hypothetical protein